MAEALPFTDADRGTCRSCPAPIVWALTAVKRKPIPIDPEPVDDGNIVLERMDGELVAFPISLFNGDAPTYVSHFATCPNSARHRKDRPDEP